MTIPEAKVAEVAEKQFPIEGGVEGLATLTLTDPAVRLLPTGRVGLDVNALAAWKDVPVGELTEEGAEAMAEADSAADAAAKGLTLLAKAIDATRTAERKTARGSGGIEGALTYSAGDFFLTGATLTQLEIAEVAPETADTLRGVLQTPVAAALEAVPVYTLDDSLKQKAARLVLKDITATEEGLKLTLGRPD